MKVSGLLFLVLCLAGCAGNRFSSNPGAAVVGPGYLETIAKYPRDPDTQYYYPSFGIRDYHPPAAVLAPLPRSAGPEVAALLTYVPEPGAQVKKITGKGYPGLEQIGLRLFTGPAQQ